MYDYDDSQRDVINPVSANVPRGGGESEVAGASVTNSETSRKVIRNAYLTVETAKAQDLTEIYHQFITFCDSLGGHQFSGEIRHNENFSLAETVLKVPPEKLDDLINYVGENTKILSSRVDSDDVTSEYYDLTTRLGTKRKALESYYKLLENAESVEEIIAIQRTIDDITEDIEAAEGRLRVLSELVGMATVTLTIRQENDPASNRREVDWGALSAGDMGYFIKNGFVTVVNVIAGLLQWLFIILIVTSPLWIPVAIVLIILIKRSKKAKADKLSETREKSTDSDTSEGKTNDE